MKTPSTPKWNLMLRLVLELCALTALGTWGWHYYGWFGAVVSPVVAAAAWGLFNVPGDPSRADHVVVAVPGWVRMLIEATIFTGAVYGLVSSGYRTFAVLLAVVALFHYLMYLARLKWLLRQ